MKVAFILLFSGQLAAALLFALRAWSAPLSQESTGWDKLLELASAGAYAIAVGGAVAVIVIYLLRLIGRLTRIGEDEIEASTEAARDRRDER
jgi:hypothetical protein